MTILLLSSTANSAECTSSTPVSEPCSGILVPEQSLRNALECKKVTVPKLEAELARCRRDEDIRMRLYVAREGILKDELEKSRQERMWMSKILTVSLGIVSGILIGMSF